MRLPKAAELVAGKGHETLTYFSFPSNHWRQIRTNNPLERIIREIRRRTRVIGAFPDGHSALRWRRYSTLFTRRQRPEDPDWGPPPNERAKESLHYLVDLGVAARSHYLIDLSNQVRSGESSNPIPLFSHSLTKHDS
jgi:hypothetical protein